MQGEPFFGGFVFGAEGGHRIPERTAMVHVTQMRDLVRHDRAAHIGWGHHQPPVDPDRPVMCAAAPAALGLAQQQLLLRLAGAATVLLLGTAGLIYWRRERRVHRREERS